MGQDYMNTIHVTSCSHFGFNNSIQNGKIIRTIGKMNKQSCYLPWIIHNPWKQDQIFYSRNQMFQLIFTSNPKSFCWQWQPASGLMTAKCFDPTPGWLLLPPTRSHFLIASSVKPTTALSFTSKRFTKEDIFGESSLLSHWASVSSQSTHPTVHLYRLYPKIARLSLQLPLAE